MNDLFKKFQENKASGKSKQSWSIVDCLVLMSLVSQKISPKVIHVITGRTPNSQTYKLSNDRGIGLVTNYKELCEKLKVEYIAENQQRDGKEANDFITRRTAEMKEKKA